jgi:hypothetical protein
LVYGNARVSGNARVYGNARVSGDALVYGNASVYGAARVSGNALVYGNARVSGDALVYGNAWVSGNASVYGNAWVSGDALVYGNARVSGNASVYGAALVNNASDCICFKGFGSCCRTTTMFRTKNGDILVKCGCFEGNLKEFEAKVKETHGSSRYAKEYLACAEVAKIHFEIGENDDK